jgi:hypothetical protein
MRSTELGKILDNTERFCYDGYAIQQWQSIRKSNQRSYQVDNVHYESLQNSSLIEHIDRVGSLICEKQENRIGDDM